MKKLNKNGIILFICSLLIILAMIFIPLFKYRKHCKAKTDKPTSIKNTIQINERAPIKKELQHTDFITDEPTTQKFEKIDKSVQNDEQHLLEAIPEDISEQPPACNNPMALAVLSSMQKSNKQKDYLSSHESEQPTTTYEEPIDFYDPLPQPYKARDCQCEEDQEETQEYQATPSYFFDSKTESPYQIELCRYKPKSPAEVKFGIHTDTFLTGAYNQALLNNIQDYDTALYFQTIINMPLDVTIPSNGWGKVEFNFTGRVNTLWGSSELAQTTRDFVKIGRAITETKHYHEIDRPVIWFKETWLKLYSHSEKSLFQIGFFPKQIGLGLILGNNYKSGNPLLVSISEKFVDQYRPGFELSSTFGSKREYKPRFYYSMYKNHSTSFDKQVEFTQSQELCDCGSGPPFKKTDPSRPIFQMSHLATVECEIPFQIDKAMSHKLTVTPFLLYNKDRNQTVEFFGDAESSLVSFGTSFSVRNSKFEGSMDLAVNLGFQDVKAWDRNVTEEHARMTLTHLFAKSFENINPEVEDIEELLNLGGEFVLSPKFPYPPDQDLSLDHKAGEEFQENRTDKIFELTIGNTTIPLNLNTRYKNSYSRFRKCYRNKYQAFMGAADMCFTFCNDKKLGIIVGYASGDDNPNDSAEKAILYRMRSDWNKVRQDKDHCYGGYFGTHSLYTGKHVRTIQLLRAHRLNQPLSQVPELTANLFSNLSYGGLGVWHKKQYKSGTMQLNSNIIAMALAHPIKFGFDPVVQDVFETFDWKQDTPTMNRFKSYDKELSQFLGIEINAFLEFFANNNVTFYSMLSVFLPGSYYKDIKRLSNDCIGQTIPLKNQYIAIAKDKSGFENAEKDCISLKDNTAVVAYVGVKFDFDTSSLHNPFRSRKKKKK